MLSWGCVTLQKHMHVSYSSIRADTRVAYLCNPTNASTHTDVQTCGCFRSYDIPPSPSSIWVRIWKKSALHALYFPGLKVPLTALCGGCGVAAVHSHIPSQSPLLESPLVGLCGQTLRLESHRERGRTWGGEHSWGNGRRKEAGDKERKWR